MLSCLTAETEISITYKDSMSITGFARMKHGIVEVELVSDVALFLNVVHSPQYPTDLCNIVAMASLPVETAVSHFVVRLAMLDMLLLVKLGKV